MTCIMLLGIQEQKARMALIICCSPAASDAAETVSSLRFAAHAKRIMTGVQVCHRSPLFIKGSIMQREGERHVSSLPAT